MNLVKPIHTKIPGRARYQVDGLRQSEGAKAFIERQLAGFRDIVSVSASTVTSRVLITFNSGNTAQSIERRLESVVAAWRRDPGPRPDNKSRQTPGLQACGTDGPKRVPAPAADAPWTASPPAAFHESGNWHRIHRQEVLDLVASDPQRGLGLPVARARLEQYGLNTLPEGAPRSAWEILVGQINSLPTYLLAAAAGVALLTGGVIDALVIMGVVAANAAIGFVTEKEADKTIQSLKKLVHPKAEVIRDGEPLTVAVEEIVVGDLLELKPGAYVAADCRIIRAVNLSIDESMLTGESMPVYKTARTLGAEEVPLADRLNMAFMGTLVTGGQGLAVVVATGWATQIGQLQALLQQTQAPQTPIERQLGRMGDQLVILCCAVCGVVFLIGFLRGYGFLAMLRTSISLAASAVPEGLPAAATINFAMGITRMRQHRVLIRHLQAVETLGAVQTICLDKTGTITVNQMQVQQMMVDGARMAVEAGRPFAALSEAGLEKSSLSHLLHACALCNEVKVDGRQADGQPVLHGSATEKALVELATGAGLDVAALKKQFRLLAVNHRSESRLFMGTLHRVAENERVLFVKGSPPEVLALCDRQVIDGRRLPLTDADRARIERENERMAAAALRVLGFAFKPNPADAEDDSGLTWLGLAAMADPIRSGARGLIEMFHRAGVETVMITGDQSPTAYAVARELNLSGGQPLTILDSTELSRLDPEALAALAKQVYVYARVSPAHKLKIVEALRAAGRTVAMTGDGINDGPALKAADIGIAMGRSGTDVARGVADVVLEEDNLEILSQALRDGRTTYGNIRKAVHFFLTTNLSEILLMFSSLALGLGTPLNVMQLLWINIISDIFPGLALSMEAPEPDVMTRPPRDPQAPLFSARDFKTMLGESAGITGGALAAFAYGATRYGLGSGAGTMAFQTLTVGQLLHAYSSRSEHSGLFSPHPLPPNPYLKWAIGGSLALQTLTLFLPPLRGFLGLTALRPADLAVVAAAAGLPLFVNEYLKETRQARHEP
ncbi:MAG: cation-transporting P-type ATPase [Desulfobacteraceae bacterium]|nr:cation-transporting P-type ATPase [Desulfobacteraceae bacterium]